MKKKALNKIIILALCFIVTSSTLVLAKSANVVNNDDSYAKYIDPFPKEDIDKKK